MPSVLEFFQPFLPGDGFLSLGPGSAASTSPPPAPVPGQPLFDPQTLQLMEGPLGRVLQGPAADPTVLPVLGKAIQQGYYEDPQGQRTYLTAGERMAAAQRFVEQDPGGTQQVWDATRKLPGFKAAWEIGGPILAMRALSRIQAGKGGDDDYLVVGNYLRELDVEGQRSFLGKLRDMAIDLPDYITSFYMSGGMAAGAKELAEQALAGQAQRGLATRVAGTMAGEAARLASPAMVPQVARGAAQYAAPQPTGLPEQPLTLGDPLPLAAAKGAGSTFIENLSEQTGDVMAPVMDRMARALLPNVARQLTKVGGDTTRAIRDVLREAHIQGAPAEILEERVSELLHGATGLGDFGATGSAAAAGVAAFQGELGEAARLLADTGEQLALEGLAFSLIPGGQAAIATAEQIQNAPRRRAAMESWRAGLPATPAVETAGLPAEQRAAVLRDYLNRPSAPAQAAPAAPGETISPQPGTIPPSPETIAPVPETDALRDQAQAYYADPSNAIRWADRHRDLAQKLVDRRRYSQKAFHAVDPDLPELTGQPGDVEQRRNWFKLVEEYLATPEDNKSAYIDLAENNLVDQLGEDWMLVPPGQPIPTGPDLQTHQGSMGTFVRRRPAAPQPEEPTNEQVQTVPAQKEGIQQEAQNQAPVPQQDSIQTDIGTPVLTSPPSSPIPAAVSPTLPTSVPAGAPAPGAEPAPTPKKGLTKKKKTPPAGTIEVIESAGAAADRYPAGTRVTFTDRDGSTRTGVSTGRIGDRIRVELDDGSFRPIDARRVISAEAAPTVAPGGAAASQFPDGTRVAFTGDGVSQSGVSRGPVGTLLRVQKDDGSHVLLDPHRVTPAAADPTAAVGTASAVPAAASTAAAGGTGPQMDPLQLAYGQIDRFGEAAVKGTRIEVVPSPVKGSQGWVVKITRPNGITITEGAIHPGGDGYTQAAAKAKAKNEIRFLLGTPQDVPSKPAAADTPSGKDLETSTPPAEQGEQQQDPRGVFAVMTSDGTIYSDPDAQMHYDVVEKYGLDAMDIIDGGFILNGQYRKSLSDGGFAASEGDDDQISEVDRFTKEYNARVSLIQRVRESYSRLSGGQSNVRVRLKDLRSALPDVPAAALNDALLQMERDDALALYPLDDPREISNDDTKAALPNSSGRARHVVYMKIPLGGGTTAVDRPSAAPAVDSQETMPAEVPQVDTDAMTEEELAQFYLDQMQQQMTAPAAPSTPATSAPPAGERQPPVSSPRKGITKRYRKPKAPQTPKPQPPESPPSAPKTGLQTAAEQARRELAESLDELGSVMKDLGMLSIVPGGFDPRLGSAAAKVAAKAVKAGIYTFAEYIETVAARFPEHLEKLAPYLEQAWNIAHRSDRSGRVGPPGKTADVRAAARGTSRRPDVVGDSGPLGTGESPVPGAATEVGEGSGDAGQPGAPNVAGGKTGPGQRPQPGGGRGNSDERLDGGGGREPGGAGEEGLPAGGIEPTGPAATEEVPAGAGDSRGSGPGGLRRELGFHITPDLDIVPAGDVTRARANVRAIEILKDLQKSGRAATPTEKEALVKYVGWGSLSPAFNERNGEFMLRAEAGQTNYAYLRDQEWEKKWGPIYKALKGTQPGEYTGLLTQQEWSEAAKSTEFAHYTERGVIEAMWDIAQHVGFTGGRVLEPAGGVGHFFGLMPPNLAAESELIGVEVDPLSGGIMQQLYPGADIHVTGFENVKVKPNSIDLAITNVPFSNVGPADAEQRYGESLSLHNYFLRRIVDALKPGGIAMVISTHHTLDSSRDNREWLAERASLVGAIRLPNNAFKKNAGTEVTTDVLILRKNDNSGFAGSAWTALREVGRETFGQGRDKRDVPIHVNEYFASHPDMALGTHSMRGKMRARQESGEEYTLLPRPDVNLADALAAAVEQLPVGVMGQQQADNTDSAIQKSSEHPNNTLVRFLDGSFRLYSNDEYLPATELHPLFGSKKGQTQLDRYIALRDHYADHLKLMRSEEATDEQIEKSRQQLGQRYDAMIRAMGSKSAAINSMIGRRFSDEASYYRLAGLEREVVTHDAKGKKKTTYKKSDVFTKRTQFPVTAPKTAGSLTDAVRISMSYYRNVDTAYVASLVSRDQTDVERELEQESLAFQNPATGLWESSEAYLAGNVREKLRQAETAAKDDAKYQTHVEALKKVQPALVAPKDVSFHLGATWLPADLLTQFLRNRLGASYGEVRFIEQLDSFVLSERSRLPDGTEAKYGTSRIRALDVFDQLANQRMITIFDTVTDADGNERRQLNDEETLKARAAGERLQKDFQDWVKKSPDRWQEVANVYNDKFNFFVEVDHNVPESEFLLPGANPEIRFREYQRRVTLRMIQEGRGMVAHGVGAGKTFVAAAIAMESKRLGLAKKPMIVAHNITLSQYATAFTTLYPNANVYVATKKDLEAKNRKKFVARVAANDYDAVVIAQSSFDLLTISPNKEIEFLQDQIAIYRAAAFEEEQEHGKRAPTVKDINRQIRKLEERMQQLLHGQRQRAETGIFFDDLGVDQLLIDEAHLYKKPPFITKLGTEIKGIDRQPSGRGMQMLMKLRHIQGLAGNRGYRGGLMMTGTPVTNTLAEAWHLTNLVAPDVVEEFSVRTFDQFVGTFGEIRPVQMQDASQNWVTKPMLSRYRNGYQFNQFIRSAWDVLTTSQLNEYFIKQGMPLPRLLNDKPTEVHVPLSKRVKAFNLFLRRVVAAYKELDRDEKKLHSYIPVMTYNLGRAAALDIRLVYGSTSQEDPGSKVNAMVDRAVQIYHDSSDKRGVQLVFTDLQNVWGIGRLVDFARTNDVSFSGLEIDDLLAQLNRSTKEEERFLYRDITRKLIARGIPAEEIAVVTDYPKEAQRKDLFEKINAGDVRFVLGGTDTLGTGANVQERAIALHHLDTPWRPSDLQQREGRIIRFGNIYVPPETVQILNYGMVGTLDAAIWGRLIEKAKMADQALSGKLGLEFDDPFSEVTVSYEDQFAALTGDDRAIRKIRLQQEERSLAIEKEGSDDASVRIRNDIVRSKNSIQNVLARIDETEALLDATKHLADSDGVPMRITSGFDQKPLNISSNDPREWQKLWDGVVDDGVMQLQETFRSEKAKRLDFPLLTGEIGGVTFTVTGEIKIRQVEGKTSFEVAAFSSGSFQGMRVYSGAASRAQGLLRAVRGVPDSLQSDLEWNQKRLANERENLARLEEAQGEELWTEEKERKLQEIRGEIARIEQSLAETVHQDDAPPDEGEGEGGPQVTDTYGMFGGGPMLVRQARVDTLQLPEPIQSHRPDVESRLQAAYGASMPDWRDKLREHVAAFFRKFRSQEWLPEKETKFAAARDLLRTLQGGQKRAMDRASRAIAALVDPLTSREYAVFNRVVLLENLSDALASGEPARFGYGSAAGEFDAQRAADEVAKDLERVHKWADTTPKIKKALERREEIVRELVQELVDQGQLSLAVLENPKAYYHQQVLQFQQSERFARLTKPLKQKKSFQRNRLKGVGFLDAQYDYNTNYVEAEISWMSDAYAALELEKTIDAIRREYDIKQQLKDKAKAQNFELLVGGRANVNRIERLKDLIAESRAMGGNDSAERNQRRVWIEELASLDPTYMYRVRIAQLMDAVRKEHPELEDPDPDALLSEDADQRFWNQLREIASDVDDPSYTAAKGVFATINDQRQMIRDRLGDKFLDWRRLADQDPNYAIWTPTPGNVFFKVHTIPERVMEQFAAGVIDQYQLTKEEVREVFAMGGPRGEMVLPVEVAKQLETITRTKQPDIITTIVGALSNAWKRTILLAPWRLVGYEARNFLGDLDPVVAVAPPLQMATYGQRAFRELSHFYRRENLPVSPRLALARDLEVIDSGMTAQDLSEFREMPAFEHLFEILPDRRPSPFRPATMFKNYFAMAEKVSRIREGTLRYAMFNYLLDERKKTGKWPTYGVSHPPAVDALEASLGPERAAAKIAREVVGDYGDVSQIGVILSRTIFPFWRFQELNLRRYPRLVSNAVKQGRLGRLAAGRSAVLAARVGWMWGLAWLVNHLLHPDEEEQLPEYYANNPHLTLGRRPDGSIRVFNNVGSLGDFLEWFGGNDLPMNVERWQKEQVDAGYIPKEMAEALAGKLVGLVSPFLKAPFEIATGKSLFPSPFEPRPIRRDEELANQVGLRDEYKLAKGTILGDGSSVRPNWFERWGGLGVVQPKKVMLDKMHAARFRFLEKKGEKIDTALQLSRWQNLKESAVNEDYQAFQYARRVAMQDSDDAGQAYREFLAFVDKLDPVEYRLNEKLEAEFIQDYLDDQDRRELHIARDYARELGDQLIIWWETDSRETDSSAERSQYLAERHRLRMNAVNTLMGKGMPRFKVGESPKDYATRIQEFRDRVGKAKRLLTKTKP